jgi:hypothetical protein
MQLNCVLLCAVVHLTFNKPVFSQSVTDYAPQVDKSIVERFGPKDVQPEEPQHGKGQRSDNVLLSILNSDRFKEICTETPMEKMVDEVFLGVDKRQASPSEKRVWAGILTSEANSGKSSHESFRDMVLFLRGNKISNEVRRGPIFDPIPKEDIDSLEAPPPPSISDIIRKIPLLPTVQPSRTLFTPTVHREGKGGSRVSCKYTTVDQTASFENIIAFDPYAGVLYPGALIQGRSVKNGVLIPVSLARPQGTLTLSDLTFRGSKPQYSITVPDIGFGQVTEGIKKLVSQPLEGHQPAYTTYSMEEFTSLDEGFMKVGVAGSWLSGSVRASLESKNLSSSSNLIVSIVQRYYTVAYSAPSSIDGFFKMVEKTWIPSWGTEKGKKQTYFAPVGSIESNIWPSQDSNPTNGNPPCYVSSVSYGRAAYLIISSNASTASLKAALQAEFKSIAAQGQTTLDIEQRHLLNQASIQMIVIGGSGEAAGNFISGQLVAPSFDAVSAWLLAGREFSANSPGVPISYQLRWLSDNSVASMSFTTRYTIKDCHADPVQVVKLEISVATRKDDKDREEGLKMEFYMDDVQVGKKPESGTGIVWRSWGPPGNYSVPLAPTVSFGDISHMRMVVEKTRGNAGWDGAFQVLGVCDDGTTIDLMPWTDQRFGDDSPNSHEFRLKVSQ